MFQFPKHAVDRSISPNDSMYVDGQEEHYFSVGYSAVKNIQMAMLAADLDAPGNILDMACGYGRVLRTLKAYFPTARLTACDIDAGAVDFCAETFGTNGKVYSNATFSQIEFNEKFDLIWCGSLLTHLDRHRWETCMKLCTENLSKDGLLVFTTHGRYSVKMIQGDDFQYGLERSQAETLVEECGKTGFGYCDYANQKDYGISIASPSWVLSFLETHSALQVCSMVETGWDRHQDVYACCYLHDRIAGEIEGYAERIIGDLGDKPHMLEQQAGSLPNVDPILSKWIDDQIKADKRPFGPRVRTMLLEAIVERIRLKSPAS